MLSLRNISKTYVTKSKTETKALRDVNLEIADSGMVFILGKSGSGKSTLLNLLGGLDSPTSGEILVDGASMQKFTPSDYANYRNNYVGFIFQEFNLLADFNVRDNVALALKLIKSDDIDGKISEALKQVELNDSYLTRRIDEMSGGEKQRIAIARALIKDSRLILADEPTGNLDSATGESIWNLLKSLSRERLVVVVSHDRESAEKYATRTIEIADGHVIADNGEQPDTKKVNKPQTATKNRLPFSTIVKMAFNNLMMRKLRTLCVILVAIFSMFSLLVTQICLSYSPEVLLAGYIKDYNVSHFTVRQGGLDEQNRFTGSSSPRPFRDDTQKYIGENCRYIFNGLVESKQDILDFGLSFVGEALELDDNSFYITTEWLERVYSNDHQIEVDGKYVTLYKGKHPAEYLSGKKIKGNYFAKESIIAGVIDSGNFVAMHMFPEYFHNKEFAGVRIDKFTSFNYSQSDDAVFILGDKQYHEEIRIMSKNHLTLSPGSEVIVTDDGVWSDNKEVNLADNEIILPYGIFAGMFGAKPKWSYIDPDDMKVFEIPEKIGQTFTFKICEYGTNKLIAEYGEVKLKGVYFSKYGSFADSSSVVSNTLTTRLNNDFGSTQILVQSSSVKDLKKFARTLRRDYLCCFDEVGWVPSTGNAPQGDHILPVQVANLFESKMNSLSFIFLTMGAILLIILVLLVINLISFSIANRKKEIGILSAIGASNKDITSIFLIETGIIAVITFVINLALSFTFAGVANILFNKAELSSVLFPFLRVDLLTVAILIAASFGLLLLAALIPIRKIIRLKPIDAIRGV